MLGVSVLFLLIGLCLGGFGLVMLILRITKKGSITLPIIVIPTAFVIVLASFIAVAVNAPDEASADGNDPSEKVEKVNKEKQGKEEKPEEEQQAEKKDKKKKETPKKEKEVKKDLPADEVLDNAIVDVIGEDRIDTYTYFEGFVTIIATAQENLTNGMTLSALQLDTIDILEQAADIDEVDTVSFSWKLPTTDSYGNDTEVVIVKETFERDTIDRINFDKVSVDNLPDIADSYNAHQSFR